VNYHPPLTGEKLAVWLSMPRFDGVIVSPACLEGSAQRTYESAWGAWLRANHKDWWPDYMEAYVNERRNQRASGEGESANQRGQSESVGGAESSRPGSSGHV
jgi:hypothetical protein